MAEVERLTVTMPAEMLAVVKAAVSDGDWRTSCPGCAQPVVEVRGRH
jgi:hypothetical protein